MKKIISVASSITLVTLLLLPVVVLAQGEEIPTGLITSVDDIIALIRRLANWFFAILLAVSLIFILMAALAFLTSSGDPAKVEKARNMLLYAVIGIGVAFLAQAFVQLVRFILVP